MNSARILTGFMLLTVAGCGANNTTRVWGKASFDGQPIESGQIVLVPLENTSGPSTGGEIVDGTFDLPSAIGPQVGGTYRVEITAYGDVRSYNPNASGQGGTPVMVREQLLPPKYNRQSELTLQASSTAEENHHTFELTR